MNQPEYDTLLLGNFNGRDKVTIARYDRCVANLVLSCKKCKVQAQEKVNPLLLKDWLTQMV